MNIFLYQLKYFLTRSHVWAFIVTSFFIYKGFTKIHIVDVIGSFAMFWFVIQTLREALTGFSVIFCNFGDYLNKGVLK